MSAAWEGWASFLLRPKGGLILFAAAATVVFLLGALVTEVLVAPLCTLIEASATQRCDLERTLPQEGFLLRIRQALLAGVICALPALVALMARLVAPTLVREMPDTLRAYAWAGFILGVLGVLFAVYYEAPAIFAPLLMEMEDLAAHSGIVASYANATLVMAGAYALVLQVPVLLVMMARSWRVRRALKAEGMA